MAFKLRSILSFILVTVLAVAATVCLTSMSRPAFQADHALKTQPMAVRQVAPDNQVVSAIGIHDDRGRPVYLWEISQDEQDRLTLMLGQDFYDTGVMGTYLNSKPHVCSHCGKETEFIDW